MSKMKTSKNLTRCSWAENVAPFYQRYHDEEWGVPVHEDRQFFEMLILEGAQAGLSWETILKRREGYRKAFHNFDPVKVARMTDAELEKLLSNQEIIRNRLKVFGARQNALAFVAIQKESGSFDSYVWQFVGGKTKVSRPKSRAQILSKSPESDALSRDLKKRGMTFVGTTIIYAFMQATGLVDDHAAHCFCAKKPKRYTQ